MFQLAQTYSDPNATAAGGFFAIFAVVYLMFLLITVPFWLWGFINAVSKPTHIWEEANQSKVLWIVLQFGLGLLGSAAYLIAIRPKLMAAEKVLLARPTAPLPAPPAGPVDYVTLSR